MSGDFEDDDNYVAGDFHTLVGNAQLNELEEVEAQREREREAMQKLAAEQRSSAMSLMQIAGLRTKKELDALAAQNNEVEDQRLKDEERKRKEIENARLVNQFPAPDIRHS